MAGQLQDRVAIVTGAGRGLGRAVAERSAGGFDGLIARKKGRYGTPDDVAEAALFSASERSGFCTGSGPVLDGGLDASLL